MPFPIFMNDILTMNRSQGLNITIYKNTAQDYTTAPRLRPSSIILLTNISENYQWMVYLSGNNRKHY
jgi:hypothetical protein